MDNLSQGQIAMLEDLRDYGLIYQRVVRPSVHPSHNPIYQLTIIALQPSSRRFSPTRLATTLTSSLPPLPTATSTAGASAPGAHGGAAGAPAGKAGADTGFIVLETNYRVYAYTGARFRSSPSRACALTGLLKITRCRRLC